MLVTVPQRGAAKPRRVAHFDCPTYVLLQVIGAWTVFIAESDIELSAVGDQPLQDGLQLTQGSTAPPVGYWWNGDLWMCASVANAQVIVMIPGQAGQAQVPLQLASDGPVIGSYQ